MAAADYALELCARIAAHTDVPGTITRTFLSPGMHAVHALLRAEMQTLGMEVRVDAIGNVRGLYAGASADAPHLLLGSHIDTVPNAGAYDGVLGVAIALALVRDLRGERLPYAIEVIAFSEEEGIRFGLPFLGSRALLGLLDEAAVTRTDADGISVAQAVRAFGLDSAGWSNACMTENTFAFLEVHIEQGPVLESVGVPLGVVTAIAGQTRFRLRFSGQANHAGTTPMPLRRDALAAAAGFITATEKLALATAGLVATVGTIQALPGAANIIPGEVVCTLDIRHAEDAIRARSAETLLSKADELTRARGVRLEVKQTSEQASTEMDGTLVQGLTAAANACGCTPFAMASGAGHDAMIVARKIPAAMLFVRTPGGISHHPDEAVVVQDVDAAIRTCLHFLHTLKPARFLAQGQDRRDA